MRWLDSITDSMDVNLSTPGNKDREALRAAVRGVTDSQTQLSNWIAIGIGNHTVTMWTLQNKLTTGESAP